MLPLFQDINLSWKSFTVFQSNYFDIKVSFQGQLLLHNNCFFLLFAEQSLFRWGYFFRKAVFSARNFYRAGTSGEQEVLHRSQFLKQLFFPEKELLLKAGTSAHYQLFQNSYILEKANFPDERYFTLSTFSGELPFQKDYFFKRPYLLQQLTFQKSYFFCNILFRRVTILHLWFLSTVALLIYSLVIK